MQDICYKMGTEIFKIEEEMIEKMKPNVADPPVKIGRILLTIHIHWSLYPFFTAPGSLN